MVTTKLYINGNDAYASYGLSLDGDGGLDALLAFRPLKEPVVNKNVTAEGAVVVCGTGLLDERTVSVPVHIVARSYADFLRYRTALFTLLTHEASGGKKKGELEVVVKNVWRSGYQTTSEEIFKSTMYYISCSQYTQYAAQPNKVPGSGESWHQLGSGYGMAKFVLTLYEPNTPAAEQTGDGEGEGHSDGNNGGNNG